MVAAATADGMADVASTVGADTMADEGITVGVRLPAVVASMGVVLVGEASMGVAAEAGANASAQSTGCADDLGLRAVLLRQGESRCSTVSRYSTVTDLARLRGWSTSQPRRTAM